MFGKAISCDLPLEFAACGAVDRSQRWILTAMQRHGQELVTMLWRILGNEQDVCDAYQSTFLHMAHHQRRRPRHPKAYIFRTASNVAISMLRHRIAERNRAMQTAQCSWRAKSPEQMFDSKSLVEQLRCSLAQLPGHLRDVVVLRDLAELSYPQVGRILGISPATARVYRCKAIRLLARWMGKERD